MAIDGFSNWPMAWACRTCQSREVAKHLLRDLIPNFGLPLWVESNKGSHMIAATVQKISHALGIKWKIHTQWRPEASGKVETLKRQLAKLCQKAKLSWVDALSLALIRLRASPYRVTKSSSFKLVYGRPWHIGQVRGNDSMWWEMVICTNMYNLSCEFCVPSTDTAWT